MSLGWRGPVAGREVAGAVVDGGVGVTATDGAVALGADDIGPGTDGAADAAGAGEGRGATGPPGDVGPEVWGATDVSVGPEGVGRDVAPRTCRVRVSRRPFISSTRLLSPVMVVASPSSRRDSALIWRSFSAA